MLEEKSELLDLLTSKTTTKYIKTFYSILKLFTKIFNNKLNFYFAYML